MRIGGNKVEGKQQIVDRRGLDRKIKYEGQEKKERTLEENQ